MPADPPTDMQMAFLRALWQLGEGSVADVQGRLEAMGQNFAPTTVATVLRRMENKGLVGHRRDGRQFVYRPAVDQSDLAGTLLSRLTRALFDGNVGALLCQLVSSDEVSRDDLEEVKRLIEAKEDQHRGH